MAVNSSFIKDPSGEPSEGEFVVLQKLRDQQRPSVTTVDQGRSMGLLSAVMEWGKVTDPTRSCPHLLVTLKGQS